MVTETARFIPNIISHIRIRTVPLIFWLKITCQGNILIRVIYAAILSNYSHNGMAFWFTQSSWSSLYDGWVCVYREGHVASNDAWELCLKIGDCRGYVAHFFQCSDCADHFGKMADEQAAKDVKTLRDGVMWMWSAHNEVHILTFKFWWNYLLAMGLVLCLEFYVKVTCRLGLVRVAALNLELNLLLKVFKVNWAYRLFHWSSRSFCMCACIFQLIIVFSR